MRWYGDDFINRTVIESFRSRPVAYNARVKRKSKRYYYVMTKRCCHQLRSLICRLLSLTRQHLNTLWIYAPSRSENFPKRAPERRWILDRLKRAVSDPRHRHLGDVRYFVNTRNRARHRKTNTRVHGGLTGSGRWRAQQRNGARVIAVLCVWPFSPVSKHTPMTSFPALHVFRTHYTRFVFAVCSNTLHTRSSTHDHTHTESSHIAVIYIIVPKPPPPPPPPPPPRRW